MLRVEDLRNSDLSTRSLLSTVPRASLDTAKAVELVKPLISDVAEHGEQALRAQAARFDGVTGHNIRVSEGEIERSVSELAPALRDALQQMIARVRSGSAAQVPESQTTELANGARIVQRWRPVNRVGLYVPGGKAVYPSSVVMNAVAAQQAGVKSIALASPVQQETGSVHPVILAAAGLLGITEVYAMGGAGAIAAFAHGVPEIGLQSVDVVTGPGNIFVAAAKRVVNGIVGIDSEAGTTEIMVLADAGADPQLVAADLVSQAEHDEAAAAVLVTDSEQLAEAVLESVQRIAAVTEHAERVEKALTGPQSAIILVKDTDQLVAVANAYAAEHLELQVSNPAELLERIDNAGAIFVGANSPVSLGDYLAGSNHVLPTGGTARFASGLGAYTFLRAQQVIEYSREALAEVLQPLRVIAEAEGLPAHAAAAAARFEGE